MQLKPVLSMATLARMPVSELPAMIALMFASPADANLYMSQFHLFSVTGSQDFALEMQARALQMSTVYRIAGTKKPAIRLLALMGAGVQSVNTPLDYLIENSDIQLDLLYIVPGQPLPDIIPGHDVAIVALGESDQSRPVLEMIDGLAEHWPRPLLNPARHILRCSRDGVYRLLKDIPGLLIPPTLRISRTDLARVAAQELAADTLFGGTYPVTVRPLVSQGGCGLAKIDNAAELAAYLAGSDEAEFFVSFHIDYRSADGLYRKARIVLIDGMPYICHLAISAHWIVHYGASGMTDSADKREEEARFMRDFDTGFAQRHRDALNSIAKKLELDYVVIDCAEAADGNLLLFEADNRGWVHATDPVDIFQYKQDIMYKAFAAFRAMLVKAMRAPDNSKRTES
ncbi:MAG: RimK family alpha-L-glutamate ligase [Proteobacteria bacterium]|nr:RimK family alpha-L-glutamate ligase [Pseudomonadota bacterium]